MSCVENKLQTKLVAQFCISSASGFVYIFQVYFRMDLMPSGWAPFDRLILSVTTLLTSPPKLNIWAFHNWVLDLFN